MSLSWYLETSHFLLFLPLVLCCFPLVLMLGFVRVLGDLLNAALS